MQEIWGGSAHVWAEAVLPQSHCDKLLLQLELARRKIKPNQLRHVSTCSCITDGLGTSRQRPYFEVISFKNHWLWPGTIFKVHLKDSLPKSDPNETSGSPSWGASLGPPVLRTFLHRSVMLCRLNCWPALWRKMATVLFLLWFNLDVITHHRAFPCPNTFKHNMLPFQQRFLLWDRHRGRPGAMLCIVNASSQSKDTSRVFIHKAEWRTGLNILISCWEQ